MEDLSEKEQIEVMRSWWSENGTYVVVGLLVGVGAVVGINQWRAAQVRTLEAASALFESLADEVAENRLEPAEVVAADMQATYPNTIYADQARLAMARLYMDQGRDQDAASELQALVDVGGDEQMRMVGRLRLAKVLLYQGKHEDVLSLVEGHTETGMGPRFNEVKGDALFALGQYEEAESAYLAVLGSTLASQLVDVDLVRMKINDLPATPAEEPNTVAAQDDTSIDEETPQGVSDAVDESAESGDSANTDEPAGDAPEEDSAQ